MKRVMAYIGTLFFLLGGMAFAQELGNATVLIPGGKFEAGVQRTWVFKQSFDDYNLSWKASDGSTGTTRKTAEFENDKFYLATITYGLFDRLNLFVKLGLVDGGEFKESGGGATIGKLRWMPILSGQSAQKERSLRWRTASGF